MQTTDLIKTMLKVTIIMENQQPQMISTNQSVWVRSRKFSKDFVMFLISLHGKTLRLHT